MHHHSQPSQPPKQAAYDSPNNPITHTPYEQHLPSPREHLYADDVSPINHRDANSKPSSDAARAHLLADHRREQRAMQSSPDVDLEYGVEQQPNEGDIAYAVEHRSEEARRRVRAEAKAGGSSGHRYHASGEERDFAADMGRKEREHERILEERGGDGEMLERESLRERKEKEMRGLDVKETVHEATGEPVVGL